MRQTEELSSRLISDTKISCGNSREAGIFALAAAADEVAAKGAVPYGANVKIMLPDGTFKSRMNGMNKMIKKAAEDAAIERVEIEGSFHPAVNYPMTVATVYGSADEGILWNRDETADSGQEIVLAGWIGLAGTIFILNEKEEELTKRFTRTFLGQIRAYQSQLFAIEEMKTAREAGAQIILQASDGGILAALHFLALKAGTGFSVDMKKLSVRQETVEVCEYFRLNPYQLMSAGCFLMTANDGKMLADRLRQKGMEAVVIGRLTNNNDKIITNGEEIRYVDRPAPDEWTKILE